MGNADPCAEWSENNQSKIEVDVLKKKNITCRPVVCHRHSDQPTRLTVLDLKKRKKKKNIFQTCNKRNSKQPL